MLNAIEEAACGFPIAVKTDKLRTVGKSKNRGTKNGRYIQRGADGEKRCTKCEQFKPLAAFALDRSRFDGRTYICRECRYERTSTGPGRRERTERRIAGQRWCRGCQAWLPADQITKQGNCRVCENAAVAARYANDPLFRQRRCNSTALRRRGVAPIPPEAASMILEEFGGLCAYCDAQAETWDHVVAVTRGGLTEPYNIVPACRPCNSSKSNRDVWEWLEKTGRMIKDHAIDRLSLYHVSLFPAQGPEPF